MNVVIGKNRESKEKSKNFYHQGYPIDCVSFLGHTNFSDTHFNLFTETFNEIKLNLQLNYLSLSLTFLLQVNGIDVSNFPHEDAVQVFLNAPEPIVVELKRRTTAATSTTLTNGTDSLNSSTTSSSRSSSDATNSVKNSQNHPQLVTQGVQTDEFCEILYDESPVSDHPDDECLPPDIDIEVRIYTCCFHHH